MQKKRVGKVKEEKEKKSKMGKEKVKNNHDNNNIFKVTG